MPFPSRRQRSECPACAAGLADQRRPGTVRVQPWPHEPPRPPICRGRLVPGLRPTGRRGRKQRLLPSVAPPVLHLETQGLQDGQGSEVDSSRRRRVGARGPSRRWQGRLEGRRDGAELLCDTVAIPGSRIDLQSGPVLLVGAPAGRGRRRRCVAVWSRRSWPVGPGQSRTSAGRRWRYGGITGRIWCPASGGKPRSEASGAVA